MTKVIDCITYFDEDMLLDFRLNVLNNYVSKFVIVEAKEDHQGNKKKLNFDIKNFSKFKNKIIYIVQEKIIVDSNTKLPKNWSKNHLKDQSQRNYISNGIEKFEDNDWIIISDLDEIPNPNAIKDFNSKFKYSVFEQKFFYYKFNLIFPGQNWYGSRICVKKYLKSPQWLRNLKFKKRPFWRLDKYRLNNILDNGGWHFCNLKKPEELLYKYKNLCETNDPVNFKEKIDKKYLSLNSINKMILEKKDIIGRNHSFKKISMDESFPKYLLNNLKNYEEWID